MTLVVPFPSSIHKMDTPPDTLKRRVKCWRCDGSGIIESWPSIRPGHFQEAVADFTQLLDRPNQRAYYGRGISYLNLGDLPRAREDFQSAEDASDYPGDHYRKFMGICEWLDARESVAADIWLDIVESLARGKIQYSDGAGGVGAGCLLWYAGVRLNDKDLERSACEFLRNKINTKGGRNWKIGNWPGPISGFLLDSSGEDALLDAITTRSGIRRKQQFFQARFYIAAKHLAKGKPEEYRDRLRSATEEFLPRQPEYYLAGYELDRPLD